MSAPAADGVGIGLRSCHYEAIHGCERPLDWLEIIPENYVDRGGLHRATLERVAERWPVIAHGVSTSIAGPDDFDLDYLAGLRRLLDRLDPPFYSDHLCWASAGGRTTFDLLPMPRNPAMVAHVARRARELQDRLGRPLVLENITYYATMPGATMREGEFVGAVLEAAGCGLLLDLNNVYLNARNHGRDPMEDLLALPLERTRQIHLAGFTPDQGGILLDSHARAVADEVWGLYRETLRRLGPVPTLIEWDTDIPALDRVLDEADRARAILREVQGGPEAAS
ncbi:MAG: DUF692 domain-containing protein [Nannocystaceae bacterium]